MSDRHFHVCTMYCCLKDLHFIQFSSNHFKLFYLILNMYVIHTDGYLELLHTFVRVSTHVLYSTGDHTNRPQSTTPRK